MPMPWPQASQYLKDSCCALIDFQYFNDLDHIFSLAKTSDGKFLLAFSYRHTQTTSSFLNFAKDKLSHLNIKVIREVDRTQDGYGTGQSSKAGVRESYAKVLEELGRTNFGSGSCAEKKILSYCSKEELALQEIACFTNRKTKFDKYVVEDKGKIRFVVPCESCDSAFGDYIDHRLSLSLNQGQSVV